MINWTIRAIPNPALIASQIAGINRHFDERLEANFRTLGIVVVRIMQHAIQPVNLKGTLMRSVSSEIDIAKKRLSVGPTAAHTAYVFTGTRPHWVPIAVLKEWAAWKLGDERLAYAVQWSIKRRGTSMGLALKGVPGTWQSSFGYGLDFIGQVKNSGRFQTALQRTAQRLMSDLVAVGTGKSPADMGI